MKYYFKVWVSTVLISPLLVIGGLVYQKSGNFSDFFKALPIWFYAVLFGSACALPALFLFRLLNKDRAKSKMPVYLKKTVHAVAGVVLLWITFYFMNRQIFKELAWGDVIWPSAYSLTLIGGASITGRKTNRRSVPWVIRTTLAWRYAGELIALPQLHLTIGCNFGCTNKAWQKSYFHQQIKWSNSLG